MSDHHFWLSEAQFARMKPLLPNKPRGVQQVDDPRVISGIIHVIRDGLMWLDAPAVYGPPKTLYNRLIRWSRIGVFDRIFAVLAGESTSTDAVMIDATHLKAHRTAASLLKKSCSPPYRTDQRRPELQAARGLRRRRQAIDIAPHRGPGQRRSMRRDRPAKPAGRQCSDRRQGL
jgi:putative transposase